MTHYTADPLHFELLLCKLRLTGIIINYALTLIIVYSALTALTFNFRRRVRLTAVCGIQYHSMQIFETKFIVHTINIQLYGDRPLVLR